MTLTKEFSNKITNLSLLGAVIVVGIHQSWGKYDSGVCGRLMQEFFQNGCARIAVPFFFIVSGYFLAKHFDEEGWWGREVGKRITSLMVPYFAWLVCAPLFFVCISIVADVVAHRPFGSSVILFGPGGWMRYLGLDLTRYPGMVQFWYLRRLFILVLLSPILCFLVRRLRMEWLALSYGMCLLVSILIQRSGATVDAGGWPGFVCYGISLSGIFWFSLGIYLRMVRSFCVPRIWAMPLLCAAIALLVIRHFIGGGLEWPDHARLVAGHVAHHERASAARVAAAVRFPDFCCAYFLQAAYPQPDAYRFANLEQLHGDVLSALGGRGCFGYCNDQSFAWAFALDCNDFLWRSALI